MTPQETLHEISVMVYRNTDDFEMRISKDCYKGLVNALEKQIPKKPLPSNETEKDPFGRTGGTCPACGFPRLYDNNDFCGKCGQKLLWESETL